MKPSDPLVLADCRNLHLLRSLRSLLFHLYGLSLRTLTRNTHQSNSTMHRSLYAFFGWLAFASLAVLPPAHGGDSPAIRPTKGPIRLFAGKDFTGLYTWLQDAKYDDPRKVFTVEDGMIRISGDGGGYICTKERYKDYHLVVEYRWGERTWGGRKASARDSGIVFHCAEPDGSFGGVFMAGIEAQIIEGGTGDILAVPGKRADGSEIPVSVTAEIVKHGSANIWTKGAKRETFASGLARIDWFGRDPGWKDAINFRGPRDLDSPGKEWTRLDVICDGGHVVYRVNGTVANEAFDVVPSSGKILIQTELAEIFVRRFELLPLDKKP
jgi:hypothetical protein